MTWGMGKVKMMSKLPYMELYHPAVRHVVESLGRRVDRTVGRHVNDGEDGETAYAKWVTLEQTPGEERKGGREKKRKKKGYLDDGVQNVRPGDVIGVDSGVVLEHVGDVLGLDLHIGVDRERDLAEAGATKQPTGGKIAV